MTKIKVKINKKNYSAIQGETILDILNRNKISVPTLCHHPDFCNKGNCRVCVVEVKGCRTLQPACVTSVHNDMEIFTETDRVKRVRNINIELIYAEHIEKCAECFWRFECKLLKYAQEYKTQITRFKDRKKHRSVYKFHNAVELDGSQCIDCRNCVSACSDLQKIDYLEIVGKGVSQEIVPKQEKNHHCILCGQCAVHCPVSAAQEQTDIKNLEKEMADPEMVKIIQFDAFTTLAIAEAFNIPLEKMTKEKTAAILQSMGFDYVFDVGYFQNIASWAEATDFKSRLSSKKNLPMIISRCAGVVNYFELFNPSMVENLSSVRSPHILGGGIIKTYWANKKKINPHKILVTTVAPCTAKKFEAIRTEMQNDGMFPVDYVLTLREIIFLLKKNNIDLNSCFKTKIKEDRVLMGGLQDSMFDFLEKEWKSGAIKTVSAGVFEKYIEAGGRILKCLKIDGIGNLKKIKNKMHEYDFIEISACQGGCAGGGGQLIPTNHEIAQQRLNNISKVIGKILKNKKNEKEMKEIKDWIREKKLENKVFFTKFNKK